MVPGSNPGRSTIKRETPKTLIFAHYLTFPIMLNVFPEYNTVRGLITASWVLLIVTLIISLIVVGVEITGPAVTAYGPVAALVLLMLGFPIISIIPTALAVVFLPRIGRTLDEAVTNRDPEKIEKARKRLLTWGTIALIFSYIIPGALLILAYIKAEEITRKIQ